MPATTVLAVDRLWITDPTDPGGAAVVAGSNQASPTTDILDGEVRHYAGGRSQAVVRDTDQTTASWTLVNISAADRAQLVAWRGRAVLVRTFEGERLFAVYWQVPAQRRLRTLADTGDAFTFDVTLTLEAVTYVEAV